LAEAWLSVVGYEGLYSVSSLGRVYSYYLKDLRRLKLNKNGRIQVTLSANGKARTWNVHKLVADAFLGPCPPGQEVRHKDGDETNNVATNLEYGTRGDNQRDSVRHGTHNMSSKERCPKKHLYDEANTYVAPDGRRMCRQCQRERQRKHLLVMV